MFWVVPLILVLLLILWILLVPVMILVHSDAGRYTLSLPGLFTARAVTGEDFFLIKGWILFVPYRFNPFKKRYQKRKKKVTTGKKRKKFKFPKGGAGMVKDAMGTIRIRRLELDLDTDDFLLNAWLFPVCKMINLPNTRLNVNFKGESALMLDLRIRLGALLWVFIRNRYKSFF